MSDTSVAADEGVGPRRVDEAYARADFASSFHDHHERLLRIAFLLSGDHDVAEDVVADAFVKAYPHLVRGGVAVWTGQELVAVGNLEGTGRAGAYVTAVRAYDPAADRWRELDWGLDESRGLPVVAWTGDRLFVGGGYTLDGAHAEARLLDVDTGEWEAVPDAPVPFGGNDRYGEVWTGKEVITLYGQAPGSTEDDPDYRVLAFDPDARTWATGPSIPDRAFDFEGSWAWTGTEITVLGGGDIRHSDQGALDGATYVPVGG